MKFNKVRTGQWELATPFGVPDEEVEATKEGLVVRGYGAGPDGSYESVVRIPWWVVLQALGSVLPRADPVSAMNVLVGGCGCLPGTGHMPTCRFADPVKP